MHPDNHQSRRRRTFFSQVAYRVKHKIAVKVATALLKLAAVAFLGLLLALVVLLLYAAQVL